MEIKYAEYLVSSPSISKCPPADLPEYAFIGRSNVGKSSLINMLVNNKKLAKTSSKPGKTQMINHFIINKDWYLVDLPGYGYAKIAITERKRWSKMISDYLSKRENLMTVFILIDSRVPPQQLDIEFINQLASKQIPLALVYTKIDKVKQNDFAKNEKSLIFELQKTWEVIPSIFYSSAETARGKQEILSYIENTNTLFV